MKILEINQIIVKIIKNHRNPLENNENHEKLRNQYENFENL